MNKYNKNNTNYLNKSNRSLAHFKNSDNSQNNYKKYAFKSNNYKINQKIAIQKLKKKVDSFGCIIYRNHSKFCSNIWNIQSEKIFILQDKKLPSTQPELLPLFLLKKILKYYLPDEDHQKSRFIRLKLKKNFPTKEKKNIVQSLFRSLTKPAILDILQLIVKYGKKQKFETRFKKCYKEYKKKLPYEQLKLRLIELIEALKKIPLKQREIKLSELQEWKLDLSKWILLTKPEILNIFQSMGKYEKKQKINIWLEQIYGKYIKNKRIEQGRQQRIEWNTKLKQKAKLKRDLQDLQEKEKVWKLNKLKQEEQLKRDVQLCQKIKNIETISKVRKKSIIKSIKSQGNDPQKQWNDAFRRIAKLKSQDAEKVEKVFKSEKQIITNSLQNIIKWEYQQARLQRKQKEWNDALRRIAKGGVQDRKGVEKIIKTRKQLMIYSAKWEDWNFTRQKIILKKRKQDELKNIIKLLTWEFKDALGTEENIQWLAWDYTNKNILDKNEIWYIKQLNRFKLEYFIQYIYKSDWKESKELARLLYLARPKDLQIPGLSTWNLKIKLSNIRLNIYLIKFFKTENINILTSAQWIQVRKSLMAHIWNLANPRIRWNEALQQIQHKKNFLSLSSINSASYNRIIFIKYKKRLQKYIWKGKHIYNYIKKWEKNNYLYKVKTRFIYKVIRESPKLFKKYKLFRLFLKIRTQRQKSKNYNFFSFYDYISLEYSSWNRLIKKATRWKKRKRLVKLFFNKKFKWPKWPRWRKCQRMVLPLKKKDFRRRVFFFNGSKKNNPFSRYFFKTKKIFYQQDNFINQNILIQPIIINFNQIQKIEDLENIPIKLQTVAKSLEEFTTYLYITYFNSLLFNNTQINFIRNFSKNTSPIVQPKLLNLIIIYKNILNVFYPEWTELQLQKITTEEARLKFIRRLFKIIGFRGLPKLDKNTRSIRKPWNFPDSWMRKRKIIFKLKILFDRLFLWLYRHKNSAYLFHFIRKRVFKFYPHSYQIIYKKNIKLKFRK